MRCNSSLRRLQLDACHEPRLAGACTLPRGDTGAATSSIAAVALWLLWSPSIERSLGICIAAVPSLCVIGGFFAGASLRRRYGGALSDTDGGIPKLHKLDLNSINFGAAAVLLIAGRLILL